MIRVGPLEPSELPGLLTQTHVHERDVKWRNVTALRLLLQFNHQLLRLSSLARHRVSPREGAEQPGLSEKTQRLLALCDGFLMPAHLLVSHAKPPVRPEEFGVHLDGLEKLLDCLVVPPREVERPSGNRAFH